MLTRVLGLQRRLIYFPAPGPVPAVAGVSPTAREVELDTDDGIRLAAWYFPVTGAHTAVLVCGGNGGDRSGRAPLASALNKLGYSAMLFDYRGYGGNPGSPSEDGLAADARAAQSWLAAQSGVEHVVYFGESLGCAVAVGLAVHRPPAALILRSPFTSLADVAAEHYPILPARRLLLDRYPSIDRIATLRTPLLVIAGDRDEVVPESMSRRLYDAAGDPKRYLVVPGADHNDPRLLDGTQMLTEIDGFLSSRNLT